MRAAYVACRTRSLRILRRGMDKLVQNSAILGGLRLLTQAAQLLESLLQRLELRHALGHMPDVLIEQCVDLETTLLRRIAKLKQALDFVQCHV